MYGVDPALRICQGGGWSGEVKGYFDHFCRVALFSPYSAGVLTGIPVIIISIFSFINGYCMGIACRIPVLVGFGLVFCVSATSLTVNMVFGLEGRVVSVLAFFTMV